MGVNVTTTNGYFVFEDFTYFKYNALSCSSSLSIYIVTKQLHILAILYVIGSFSFLVSSMCLSILGFRMQIGPKAITLFFLKP